MCLPEILANGGFIHEYNFFVYHSHTNVISGPIIVCNLYKIRINNLNREKRKKIPVVRFTVYESNNTLNVMLLYEKSLFL